MYPSLWYHTEYFHGPNNSLCSTYQSLSLFPIPSNHFTFCCLHSFPQCQVVEIKQYATFLDWLLSLSDIHLRYLHVFISFFFYFLSIFYWLCYYSCPNFFLPFIPLCPAPTSPSYIPSPLGSCPWVVHIRSLAPPILLLTSPCLFCAYQLCFLFPIHFPPFSPIPLPADNPLCDWSPFLWFCSCSSCLFSFYFCFSGSVVELFRLLQVCFHFTVLSFLSFSFS